MLGCADIRGCRCMTGLQKEMAMVRWFQDQGTDAFHIHCHAADKAQKQIKQRGV